MQNTPLNAGAKTRVILVTGLALFAMFFGAGNLILPVLIGVQGGTNASAATLGFIVTGVLLPVLAMVAIATSANGIDGLAERLGKYPGLVFAWMAILTTGVLFAVPRVATVSYSMSVKAIFEQPDTPGTPALIIHTIVFMAVTALLVLNPSGLVDRIGAWLTPALIILMVVLIVSALVRLPAVNDAPTTKYANSPLISGLLEGYNTLDALAAFVFGMIIITSLRRYGIQNGKPMLRATALVGLIAGVLLALVYFGLASVGMRINTNNVENGGDALALAAAILFGAPGQWILAIIAVLACLTTSVGLIGASVQFTERKLPGVSRGTLLIAHCLVALALANLGLTQLTNLLIPILLFCYPITIAVIIVTVIDIFVPGHLHAAYRVTLWTAAVFGFIDAIAQGFALFQTAVPQWLTAVMQLIPFAQLSLGWVVPAACALVIGLAIDGATGKFARQSAK